MDVLYPCSLCSRTFMLRNDFLSHMTTSHPSSVPSVHTNEIKCLFNCPQCCKQFSSKIVLKKHIQMKHNISIQKLSEYTPTLLKTCRISRDLNNYLFLKELLPDNYNYKILDYKDLLYGQFKVKFQIINIDTELFLDWLNNLCQKSKVYYMIEKIQPNSSNCRVYKCKNIDYWDNATNSVLQFPTNCKATLSVVMKPLNRESSHLMAIISLNHCHCHPMYDLTSLKLYNDICNVYNQLIPFLQNGYTVTSALQKYKKQIVKNHGKPHYLHLSDSAVRPDVEFVYNLYYMHIKKSSFSSPFTKRAKSLIESINCYNAMVKKECAIVDFVGNDIVIAIQTPLMKTNHSTVLVCSTSFNSCKTWFMFGKNDKEISILVGVIIATDDKECLLQTGLNSWKRLGGSMKTVVVEFIHKLTFQSIFPDATICVSKFHFLLGVWKWLFSVTKKNNLNDELNCFVELKKLVCSENFISNHCFDTNFASILTEKYPNFKQFMQNISVKNHFLLCSSLSTNPCFTIFERKLIYYHTKSLSIIQMFHFVIDEIDLFYEFLSSGSPNNQQSILNDLIKIDEDNFTYYSVSDDSSMYLVESVSDDKFFVDMDIGLCSCTIINVCAPCVHQIFLNKYLIGKGMNCSTNISVMNNSNIKQAEINTNRKEFEIILSEFQSVNNKIKEQFSNNPDYFKAGIQSFTSALKNNVISDNSLFSACHSLVDNHQTNLDKF